MKGRSFFLGCVIVGLVSSGVVHANPVFKSQDDVVTDYTAKLNKMYEPFFTVPRDNVGVEKMDVNKDGSSDLMLYEKAHCLAPAECEIDVYLCTNDEEDCAGGQYCFADNIYKDQVRKKGRNLECKIQE